LGRLGLRHFIAAHFTKKAALPSKIDNKQDKNEEK